jgi:hypothetical protein
MFCHGWERVNANMSRHSKLITAATSLSLLAAGPAAAATRAASAPAYSPWAALSAVASQGSSQALCGTAIAGAAAAAAQGAAAPGCVLPVVDAPPPPPVAETAPLSTPAAVVAGGGIGLLPLLLGLGALGGLAAVLLSNGNGRGLGMSPG